MSRITVRVLLAVLLLGSIGIIPIWAANDDYADTIYDSDYHNPEYATSTPDGYYASLEKDEWIILDMGENFNDWVHRDPNPDESGDQRVKYFIRLHTAPGSINPSVSFYDNTNEECFPLEMGKIRASNSEPVFLVGLNLKLNSLGYEDGTASERLSGVSRGLRLLQ